MVIPVVPTPSNGETLAYVARAKFNLVSKASATFSFKDVAIIYASVNEYEHGRIGRENCIDYGLRHDNRDDCFSRSEMLCRHKACFWRLSLIKVPVFRQSLTDKQDHWLVVNPSWAISEISNDVGKLEGPRGRPYSVDFDLIHPQLRAFRIHKGISIRFGGIGGVASRPIEFDSRESEYSGKQCDPKSKESRRVLRNPERFALLTVSIFFVGMLGGYLLCRRGGAL